VVPIRGSQSHPSEISRLLHSKGAPQTCYALSDTAELDGREILSEGLAFIVGRGMGTLLSCIPGELAYFEDEDQPCILERKQLHQRR
jgi:hypothetical protein